METGEKKSVPSTEQNIFSKEEIELLSKIFALAESPIYERFHNNEMIKNDIDFFKKHPNAKEVFEDVKKIICATPI